MRKRRQGKNKKRKTKQKYINIYYIYTYTERKNWLLISPSQRIMSILNPSYQEEKGFPGGPDSKESSCNAGYPGLITGSGRSPGEGNSYWLQYSCLENSMDRGAWQATYSPQGQKESGTTEWLRWKNKSYFSLEIRRLSLEKCTSLRKYIILKVSYHLRCVWRQ